MVFWLISKLVDWLIGLESAYAKASADKFGVME